MVKSHHKKANVSNWHDRLIEQFSALNYARHMANIQEKFTIIKVVKPRSPLSYVKRKFTSSFSTTATETFYNLQALCVKVSPPGYSLCVVTCKSVQICLGFSQTLQTHIKGSIGSPNCVQHLADWHQTCVKLTCQTSRESNPWVLYVYNSCILKVDWHFWNLKDTIYVLPDCLHCAIFIRVYFDFSVIFYFLSH